MNRLRWFLYILKILEEFLKIVKDKTLCEEFLSLSGESAFDLNDFKISKKIIQALQDKKIGFSFVIYSDDIKQPSFSPLFDDFDYLSESIDSRLMTKKVI